MSTQKHPMKTRSMTRHSESNPNQDQNKSQSQSVLSRNQIVNRVFDEWFLNYLKDKISESNNIKITGLEDTPLRKLIYSKIDLVTDMHYKVRFYLSRESFSVKWQKFVHKVKNKQLALYSGIGCCLQKVFK